MDLEAMVDNCLLNYSYYLLKNDKILQETENFFQSHDNIYMQGQIFASRLERRRRMTAMNNDEFERFVLKFGKDILRFCRMTAGDAENGDELYQDTMLKLLEKKKRLDSAQNTKGNAD